MQKLKGNGLKKAIDDYIINYSIEAGLAEKTIKNKKNILYRLFAYLNGNEYRVETVRSFVFYLFHNGWKTPETRVNLIRMLRAFTNFLYRRKYISVSFAQELVKPKVPEKPFDYIAPGLVEKIINFGTKPSYKGVRGDNSRNRIIKKEVKLALRFALRTGLRISELISLSGNDINLYDSPPTFWVNSKGGDRDLLPLPKDMVSAFESRLKNDRVFKITDKTCNLVLKRGAEELNIKSKITCHSLRHIFASNLVKQRVPIQMVQRLMRHSSVEITDRTYTHLNVNDLAIVMNQQAIIRDGLEPVQIFDNLEQAIKQSGVENDRRFKIEIKKEETRMFFKVFLI